ncbi:pro-resilin-like [Cherax quadricarinatus]|uniref:pro-resilin-like n=1 Tax=Cherax quadricarinatus TaxID=27406 RepID=UPI002377D98C|nr:pro-resilin-like [Cherax quadricarinatus]
MVSKVMVVVAVVVVMIGVVFGAPQYDYDRAQAPSSLYETPQEPVKPQQLYGAPSRTVKKPQQLYGAPSRTVKKPQQLYGAPSDTVKEPQQLYEAPSDTVLEAQPQNIVPQSVSPPPMEGMPYDFEWGVQDLDSGNTFSHVENSDGSITQGEYRVLMPDGRTQVVKFFDNGGGFNAEVTYEK